jgi:hypothetical protein
MYKQWIFCIENPSETDKNRLMEMYSTGLAECMVFQKQLASSTVIQLKGFLNMQKPTTISTLQNLLHNAKLQPAKGSPLEIIQRITLPAARLSGPWYYGWQPIEDPWADGAWLDTYQELDKLDGIEWEEELSEDELLKLLE